MGTRLIQALINSSLARRLFAGIWFAMAAAIPVGFFFLLFKSDYLPLFGGSLILTTAIPTLIAGIFGCLLGSTILEVEETKSAVGAAGKGLLVSMLSYLLLITVSTAINAIPSGDIIGTIVFFAFVFVYGLLFVGWLIAIVGVAAGLLLYLFRLRIVEGNKEPEH